MEKLSLSIEQWLELIKTDENISIPVWFQVVSNSMYPLIRANKDKVMLVPVRSEALKVGNIVLFPVEHANGDYCLHRIYRINYDKVQTLGDSNKKLDQWISKDDILGRAVMIKRGNLTIVCDKHGWLMLSRFWNLFYRIRPVMLLPFSIGGRCKSILRRMFGK